MVQVAEAIPWYAWIAIIGIVGGIVVQVVSMQHRHAERMEMLRQGIAPPVEKDAVEEEV